MPIYLPEMPEPQQGAWEALFEIYEALPEGWVLVGGQAVYLHCIERPGTANRATTDADTTLDVRSHPDMLHRFTKVLVEKRFEPDGETLEGHHHRFVRGATKIDVLIPRFLGERAASRRGATGGTTIAAPGSQQAIHRAETVEVSAGGREGRVIRTSLVGSLVGKAAALEIHDDPGRERHMTDFASLAAVSRASDFRNEALSARDVERLANMLGRLLDRPGLVEAVPEGAAGVDRIRAVVKRAKRQ